MNRRAPKGPVTHGQAGFSLIELAVVVTMITILIAVAVPSARSMMRATRLRSAARTLAGDLTRARGMVVSGRQNFTGWTNDDRTQHAGIRFLNATSYIIFADQDEVANGAATEFIVRTRTFDEPVQTVGVLPEIRFRKNGTLAGGPADVELSLQDTETGTTKTLRVAFGGKTDIVR